jgi:hypothetical protein
MRIQHDTTLPMNLQVEIELPRQIREAGIQPTVIVMPTGGDGDPAALAHRWSFRPDEAEQLGRNLQDAAQRARDMT